MRNYEMGMSRTLGLQRNLVVLILGLGVFLISILSGVRSLDAPAVPVEAVAEVVIAPPSTLLNVSGFAWAENLFFDGQGNLFVSDMTTGILWRIYEDDYGTYTKAPVEEFNKTAGLTLVNGTQNVIYAAVALPEGYSTANASLVAVNTTGGYTSITNLPSMGNGLSVWIDEYGTPNFFVALSYGFVAGKGELVVVDGQSGEVTTLFPNLSGVDGVEVWCPTGNDEGTGCLLYFNEVLSGSTFYVYDLDQGQIVNQFLPPQPSTAVDDFCLSPDGSTIYAADFMAGNLISFASDGSSANATILATGFTNPTAVRRGDGIGFRSTSLYVSEGGGTDPSLTNRRIIEVPNVF